MVVIKTSLEQYVEEFGFMGTFHMLDIRIRGEKDHLKREFFITCRSILKTNEGGRIFEAARKHHVNK